MFSRFLIRHFVSVVQETSIELVIIDDDGVVQSVCEQPLFGIIKDIAVLRWNGNFHQQILQVPFIFFLVLL